MSAPVTPWRRIVRAVSLGLVLGLGAASSGVLMAAPASAASDTFVGPYKGIKFQPGVGVFPKLEGRTSPFFVHPRTNVKYRVYTESSGLSYWVPNTLSKKPRAAASTTHGNIKTSLPDTKISDEFAEMTSEKNYSVNAKEPELDSIPKEIDAPEKSPDSTRAKGRGVGDIADFFSWGPVGWGLAAGGGAAIALTCGPDPGQCLTADDPLGYSLGKTYPLGNIPKFMVGQGWIEAEGDKQFRQAAYATDSMGNVFLPMVVEDAYAYPNDGSSSYPGHLFLWGTWEGPEITYPNAPTPYPLSFYELQCTHTAGNDAGLAEWGTKKVRPHVPNGWQFGGGPGSTSGGYFSPEMCAQAGIDTGGGSTLPMVTGVRGFTDSYDPDGVMAVQATEADKHKPLNEFFWSTDMVQDDGSISPDMTQFIFEQECVAADGSVTKINAKTYGDEQSVHVPSCKEHNAGIASKEGTLYADFGEGAGEIMSITPGTTTVPGCGFSGTTFSDTPCELFVALDGTPCVVGSLYCENWSEIRTVQPERIECRYGRPNGAFEVMSSETCNSLERSYGLRHSQLNSPNTDGRPETGGQNYWEDNIGDPSTRPSNGTSPTDSPSSWMNIPPKQEWMDCAGDSFANLTTVIPSLGGCILKQAFQPDHVKTQAAIESLTATAGDTSVSRIGQAAILNVHTFSNILTFHPDGTGCKGPPVPFAVDTVGIDMILHPFSACDDPIKTVAATVNMVIAVTFVLAGAFSIARAYAAAFGYNLSYGKGIQDTLEGK